MVDQPPHLLHPPAGPGPDLRRRVIEDRNAVGLGPPGDPPVEARIVDQHDRVGPMMAEIAIGPAGQIPELVQVHQHAGEPHHGQGGQVGVQLAAGRGHLRAAVADGLEARAAGPAIARIRLAPCRSPLGSPAEKKIVSGWMRAYRLRPGAFSAAKYRKSGREGEGQVCRGTRGRRFPLPSPPAPLPLAGEGSQ